MEEKDQHTFRDRISTVNEDGKRNWLFVKKPKGKYFTIRAIVGYLLLVFLFVGPFLTIQGEPFVLLDVVHRKFVLFGQTFRPHDFHLFGFAMITLVVFVILFTVIFGRLFCGWVCPQTIFMELVFRRIEYWVEGDSVHQRRLQKEPLSLYKIRKKVLKHSLFLLVSFFIANTFLGYFIGGQGLVNIITEGPVANLGSLISLLIFSGVFYFVFAFFREQVCTNVCPYGRLQGVLLDRHSFLVAYDYLRGENRGKLKANEVRTEVGKGDCIDCGHCVDVCPTGIDIRNGTQMECVNCTACMDACDFMMEKIHQPKGLIRFSSEDAIAKGHAFLFTTRMKAYTVLLLGLIAVFCSLLFLRSDVETTLLRTPGMLFQKTESGAITNLYNYSIQNKRNDTAQVDIRLENKVGNIQLIGKLDTILPLANVEGSFFVELQTNQLDGIKTELKFGVYLNQNKVETLSSTFVGPKNQEP